MAILSIDSRPVLAAVVRFPARGVWTATLDLDGTDVPSGRVSIACDGAAPLVGTVVRGDLAGSLVRLLVVGGAADMSSAAFRQSLLLGATDDAVRGRLLQHVVLYTGFVCARAFAGRRGRRLCGRFG